MKQKIAPTSPKQKFLNGVTEAGKNINMGVTKRPASFLGFGFFFFIASVIGGFIAAFLVFTQAEKIGIPLYPSSETTVIVRDGSEAFQRHEEYLEVLSEEIRPTMLRLFKSQDPAVATEVSDALLTETEFAGYGFFLTSDGVGVTLASILTQPGESVVAMNHNGEVRAISNIYRDERSGLAFFTFAGNGFQVIDIADNDQGVSLSPAYVFDFTLNDTQPIVYESLVRQTKIPHAVNPDDFIRSSEDFFLDASLLDGHSEFPKGTPVYRGDGSLIGLFNGTKDNPHITTLFERTAVVNQYLQSKKVAYPFLGVTGISIDSLTYLPASLRNNQASGFLIQKKSQENEEAILEDSPAEKAGLLIGDTLLEFNGRPINGASSLASLLLTAKPGDSATVLIDRQGTEETKTVTIQEMP